MEKVNKSDVQNVSSLLDSETIDTARDTSSKMSDFMSDKILDIAPIKTSDTTKDTSSETYDTTRDTPKKLSGNTDTPKKMSDTTKDAPNKTSDTTGDTSNKTSVIIRDAPNKSSDNTRDTSGKRTSASTVDTLAYQTSSKITISNAPNKTARTARELPKKAPCNNLDSQIVFEHPLSINEDSSDSEDDGVGASCAKSEVRLGTENHLNSSFDAEQSDPTNNRNHKCSEDQKLQQNLSTGSFQDITDEKMSNNLDASQQQQDAVDQSFGSNYVNSDSLNPLVLRKQKDKSLLDSAKSKSTPPMNLDKPLNNRIGVYFSKSSSESTENLIFTYRNAEDSEDEADSEDSSVLQTNNVPDRTLAVMSGIDGIPTNVVREEDQVIGDNINANLIIPGEKGFISGVSKKKKVPTATLR